jgi:hypothetical protein
MPNFLRKKLTKSLQRKLKLKSKLLQLLAEEEWESALSNPLDSDLASEDEDAIMELSLLSSVPPQCGNLDEIYLNDVPPLMMPNWSCDDESSVGSSESYQPPPDNQ